ncbi:DUF4239 domain-containing protein [Actinoplanes regularis]|uniref:bestrophin-like domain n=1 Tax=Actinoplanes regularis TaxID=52697 RepID=UPI0024A2EA94|nr:DUF4239 domain-containing protein [Actinoplanes regularis]GLW29436.1 hypothetical protein Areg01_23760 [Actinoplanes regularis]
MENSDADLPLWAVMLLVVGMTVAFAVGGQALIRWMFPKLREKRHNDVAGFLVAVIGVIYAVTVGFIIAEQWNNFTDAREHAQQEAFALSSIAQGGVILGPIWQAQMEQAVVRYNQAVIEGWPQQGDAEELSRIREEQTLDPLFALLDQVRPTTPAQRAYVDQASKQLTFAVADREERLYRAGTSHLERPLWVLVVFASGVILLFCMLFGLESRWLHYTMITGVAMTVSCNLLLVVLLNHPLSGTLQVSPDAYKSVVRDLTR